MGMLTNININLKKQQMKHKIVAAFFTALLVSGIYMAYQAQKSSTIQRSNTQMANIEALAQEEVTTFPCLYERGRICTFLVKDADNVYKWLDVKDFRYVSK